MSVKKLTKKNQEKLDLIKKYLTTSEFGKRDGIMLADNDETYFWYITNAWFNASGIHIKGKECGSLSKGFKTDTIWSMAKLFNACKKGDEDFVNFLERENV